MTSAQRKPEWLRRKRNISGKYTSIKNILKTGNLNTVCESASCPNRYECFSCGTATFMILGEVCSRECTFCGIKKGIPTSPSPKEAQNLADAAVKMNLSHVVITSVTRDDLPDGGSKHFADVIFALRKAKKDITIEVLIPDFGGNLESLRNILEASPNILNHNIETVERLYRIRPKANINRSIEILKKAKDLFPKILTKSGLMLGLGEKVKEIYETIEKIASVNCDILTIGQYLPPSSKHEQLIEYVEPIIFKTIEKFAQNLGFKEVYSGPFVRSSYHAYELSKAHIEKTIL